MQIWKLEGLRNPKQSLSLQHVFLRGINEIPPDHKICEEHTENVLPVLKLKKPQC